MPHLFRGTFRYFRVIRASFISEYGEFPNNRGTRSHNLHLHLICMMLYSYYLLLIVCSVSAYIVVSLSRSSSISAWDGEDCSDTTSSHNQPLSPV